jgi:PST family polysaccharide transporter
VKTNKSKLIGNFFALISIKGLELLIPLLTIPYLLRTIGIEKYGTIGFALAFATYFGTISQYGFAVTATRDIARTKEDKNELNKKISSVFFATLILSISCMIAACALIAIIPAFENEKILFFLCTAQAITQALFPTWIFQGIERMAFISYMSIISKIMYLAGLLIFVHRPEDYVLVPILNITSNAAMLIGSIWIVNKTFKIKINWPGKKPITDELISSRHAFANQFTPTLYNNTTIFILGVTSSPTNIGIFTAAMKIIDAACSLAYVISNTFLPHLSRKPDHHKAFTSMMISIGVLGTGFLLLLANAIAHALLPSSSIEIAEMIRYASPSVLAIFVMLTFGTNYLMLKGRDSEVSQICTYTSIFFSAASMLAIPKFELFGALTTLVGARITIAAALILKYLKTERSIKKTLDQQ